ncbi:hypothetical protein SAMN06297387_101334 [Streptomyces zhaozhouensis]|uniref:FTP domain-containing protein n=1 Tax=Streptomyces zhaozhouensis TaxID=1300267 RepID=A0A286DJL2_9ACTN|nr:hypothetical protein [Streptomyces zhaozhouensis]SOD58806.1 hypothetical protein SAMN06297387_101334 [Streptomyces zhaozhouensis]
MRDEESHETTRRRWPAVTAVAASVVLLAGTFYGVGMAEDGEDGSGDRDEPLALDAREGVGELAMDGASAPARPALGPLVLEGDPPPAPEAAAVHHFDEDGVDAARVAALAADLGLAGEPVASGGSWTVVGTSDGEREGALLVADEAPGHWFYSLDGTVADATGAVAEPAGPGSTSDDPDASVSSDGTLSSEGMPPADGRPAPTEEEALRAAGPLLDAWGLEDAAVDASTVSGAHRQVVAEPTVGGLPVAGMDVVATVGHGGELLSVSGVLGVPTEGEERPVSDASAALERVNEGAGTAAARDTGRPCLQRGADEAPADEARADGARADESIEPALPDLPCDAPGDEPAEATPATVELGLSLERSEGEPLLVPAWLFRAEDAEGRRHTVAEPAVEHVPSPASGDDDARVGEGGDGEAEEGDGAESVPAEPAEPAELPAAGLSVVDHAPEARTLTVSFWAGVCDTYQVRAHETDEEVTLSVERVGPESDEVCIMLAEQQTDEVALDEPVGDRRLVDEEGRELTTR